MVAKLSVSLSEELTAVLDELARRRGDDRSPLIETLLRENPIVQEGVTLWRKEAWTRPAPPPPGGKDDEQPAVPGVSQETLDELTGHQRKVLSVIASSPMGLPINQVAAAVGLSDAISRSTMGLLLMKGLAKIAPQTNPPRFVLAASAKAPPKSKEAPRGPVAP